MRPRNSDGTWKTPFNPSQVAHAESTGGDYTEGNAWQYTWHVQHDVPGLISLFGGEEPFLNKLDSLFTLKLETTQADVTGLIGQYAHGNEPSHHITYLYALAGRPERTQELVREIFDTQYRPEPDGLCGNDDCRTNVCVVYVLCHGILSGGPGKRKLCGSALRKCRRLCFIWQTERHSPSLQTASPKNINTLTAYAER